MSKSYKKAIFKDKNTHNKSYNKVARRRNKFLLKSNYHKEDYQPLQQREIINDYDICDYRLKFEFSNKSKELLKKWRRK